MGRSAETRSPAVAVCVKGCAELRPTAGNAAAPENTMRSRIQFGFAAVIAVALFAVAARSSASAPETPASSPAAATAAPASPETAPQTGTPSAQPPPAASSGSQTSGAGDTADKTSTDKNGSAEPPTGHTDAKAASSTTTTAKTDVLPSPGEALNPHIKKGSEDDVDAVGTRNIGGRGLGNWYTVNGEISMGKQYAVEIEKSAHLLTDPVVVEYVNRIGQNIVKNSDCKVPFTIKVIDSDEINAMALPGGFFYVNSGLIMAADEEAELAGV